MDPSPTIQFHQPASSGGLLTYEGRFEILTLMGLYTSSENGAIKSRDGGLSVSLASPDGQVIGGGVAGLLVAATPIQIVVGSFEPNGLKTQKRKYKAEPKIASIQLSPATATVTAAMPISQAQSQVQNQGEADQSLSYKDLTNSMSTDTSDFDVSGPIAD